VTPVAAGSYVATAMIDDANYEGTATGTLVVGKVALRITAASASMMYGGAVPNLTGTITGAVGGDGITASYTTAASSTSSIGIYAITARLDDPQLRHENYSVSIDDGVLTISPATLTVCATSTTVAYNSEIPILTGILTGVVNNDPVTSTYSTTAARGFNAGTYSIRATLVADSAILANYTISNTPGTLTITKAAGTLVGLRTSAQEYYFGQPLTLTASVTNSAGAPDGTVSFYDGNTLLASVALRSGNAVYSSSALSIGTHSMTATYAGGSNYEGSNSGVLAQNVLPPAVDISGMGPDGSLGSITMPPGGSASTQFQIAALGTLGSTITLACSGLPSGLVCELPSTIRIDTLPATVTVTVRAANNYRPSAVNAGPRGLRHMGWALALLLPQIAIMSRKRRPRLGSLLMILAFAAGAALTGCGGHASTSDAGKTPPGTYTAMITATAPGATPITSRLTVVVWQQS
jgi:hypothetical protein